MTDSARTTPVWISEPPIARTVDAHTGMVASIAEASAAIDGLVVERDRAVRQRDDAVAERDNMIDLAKEVGRLGDYLKHAVADRDDIREEYDELRVKYEGAQCRMDELSAEVRGLQSDLAAAQVQRDTAIAQAGR